MDHLPRIMLPVCFTLLLATVLFGLSRNLPVLTERPLLPGLGQPTQAQRPLRFVIVAPQYDHPVWSQILLGARAAATDLQIEVEYTGPRRASVTDLAELLNMAAAAQVDGIITQGAPDPGVAAAIAKAIERGIPVITTETDLPDPPSPRITYVGSDNYLAGREVAQELIRRTGGKAVIGIVRGHFGPEGQDLRVQGFRDALADVADMRVVAVESSELNRTVAGQKALAILREHPDVTVLYGTTPLDVIGLVQSVTALGARGRVMVIGWDYLTETADYVTAGDIQVVVVQEPIQMGRRAVEALSAYLSQDLRPASRIETPFSLRSGGYFP